MPSDWVKAKAMEEVQVEIKARGEAIDREEKEKAPKRKLEKWGRVRDELTAQLNCFTFGYLFV